MALVKREPRGSLFPILMDIEKLFDESLFDWDWPFRRAGREFLGRASVPAMDVYEDENNIHIKAELPGVEEKDIHLEVVDNTLTLRAERRKDEEVKEENYYRREQSFGVFERAFTLPQHVKAEGITAKLKKGVLHVIMPKGEEAKSKKIPVRAEK